MQFITRTELFFLFHIYITEPTQTRNKRTYLAMKKSQKKKGKNVLQIFFVSIDFPKKKETKETKGKKGKNELQISSLHNSANPDIKQIYFAMHASIDFQKKEKQKGKNELQISYHKTKKNAHQTNALM